MINDFFDFLIFLSMNLSQIVKFDGLVMANFRFCLLKLTLTSLMIIHKSTNTSNTHPVVPNEMVQTNGLESRHKCVVLKEKCLNIHDNKYTPITINIHDNKYTPTMIICCKASNIENILLPMFCFLLGKWVIYNLEKPFHRLHFCNVNCREPFRSLHYNPK